MSVLHVNYTPKIAAANGTVQYFIMGVGSPPGGGGASDTATAPFFCALAPLYLSITSPVFLRYRTFLSPSTFTPTLLTTLAVSE